MHFSPTVFTCPLRFPLLTLTVICDFVNDFKILLNWTSEFKGLSKRHQIFWYWLCHVTNLVAQSSSWEATSSSANQDISHISWKSNVHCLFHVITPLLLYCRDPQTDTLRYSSQLCLFLNLLKLVFMLRPIHLCLTHLVNFDDELMVMKWLE